MPISSLLLCLSVPLHVSASRCHLQGVTVYLFISYSSLSAFRVGVGYGLDGPGIQSLWRRDFSHTSRPVLGSHPAYYTVPCLSLFLETITHGMGRAFFHVEPSLALLLMLPILLHTLAACSCPNPVPFPFPSYPLARKLR
jgi:hypothetical protein